MRASASAEGEPLSEPSQSAASPLLTQRSHGFNLAAAAAGDYLRTTETGRRRSGRVAPRSSRGSSAWRSSRRSRSWQAMEPSDGSDCGRLQYPARGLMASGRRIRICGRGSGRRRLSRAHGAVIAGHSPEGLAVVAVARRWAAANWSRLAESRRRPVVEWSRVAPGSGWE